MARRSPYAIVLSSIEKDELETVARKYTSLYCNIIRAKVILLAAQGLENKEIGKRLDLPRQIVSKWRKRFFYQRLAGLHERPRRGKETKKFEEPEYKDIVFQILHSPPSSFKFNRTTWRLEDLYQTMKAEGFPLSKAYINKIIKNAGYRFIKARKVLTSNDPQYREKLQEIITVLSNLKPNEKFFSIDEFGPLAIKIRGGRSWTPPQDKKKFLNGNKAKGA